jgi:hypothetical protein
MQEQLKKALDFANYQQTFSIQKKVLKEKIDAKLTYGFNGGLFHIDQSLLTFVDMLCNNQRISGVVILDSNGNPVVVDNMTEFKDEIFSRYFEATHDYFEKYQSLKKSRSVEKLLDNE